MAMRAREPLGSWRFPVLLLFLGVLAAFAERLDEDDGEEEEVAEEEPNLNMCPFGGEAPVSKVQHVMDPLPHNVTVRDQANVSPGVFQNCPRIIVKPSQRMVIKAIDGLDDNRREYTFLKVLLDQKVAISPVPFFFADVPRLNKHFVFMEEIKSHNLGDVRKPDAFDVNILELMVAQMLYQVTILHKRNIVHRDLKPEQWLLSPPDCAEWVRDHDAQQFVKGSCQLILTDYDFACTSGSTPSPFKCGSETWGTPYFMPQEPYNATPSQPSRDIWSLAVSIVSLGVDTPRNRTGVPQTAKNANTRLGTPLTDILDKMFRPTPDRAQALHLFQIYVGGRMVDGKLPDMLGLTDGATSWATREHPQALDAAKEALENLGVSLPGRDNAYQLYAALVERHYYASRYPVPDWVLDYGERLGKPSSAGVKLADGGSGEAREIVSSIGSSFPLETTVVGQVGSGKNFNGVLPVVRITGQIPVVIAGEATAVQIFAHHASSGPQPYFFVERGQARFSFLGHVHGSPIKLNTPLGTEQWQVAKLIVAQILWQLTLLQRSSLALQQLWPNHWRLRPVGCKTSYKDGDVSAFVKRWCQVVLVGFDEACAMEGVMPQRSSGNGSHPVKFIECPGREEDVFKTDVGLFGVAIVKIFASGVDDCHPEDCTNWPTKVAWPKPISNTIGASLSPIEERPRFDKLFKAYKGDATDSTLATMLELRRFACLGCKPKTPKNWLSKDVPPAIAKEAKDALMDCSPSDDYSKEALQLHAILVEKYYAAARKTVPLWTKDFRRRLNSPVLVKRRVVDV